MKILPILISLLLFSCQTQTDTAAKIESYPIQSKKEPTTVQDTLHTRHIYKECALYISPGEKWFTEKQNSMSEDAWMEVVSDVVYYQSIAEDGLKLHDIEIFYRLDDVQTFFFHMSNDSIYKIGRDSLIGKWGFLLFNSVDDPIFWNSTDIDDELKNYFKK